MIEVKAVGLCFGERIIFDGFSCRFGLGINLLAGPSGCGKSSLIAMIAGILSPEEGEINVPAGTRLSYCGNRKSMFYERSLHWNLRHLLKINELIGEVARLADSFRVGAWFDRPLSRLSGGERRKAEVLFCLAKPADVYLLDEPFSGLDEQSKSALGEYLSAHRHQACYIVVNHDQTVSLPIDNKIEIVEGKAICDGEVEPFVPSSAPDNHKSSFFFAIGHLFGDRSWLMLAELLLCLVVVFSGLGYLALLPPSLESSNRIAAENDPNSGLLFEGDHLSYDYFSEKLLTAPLLALPLAHRQNDAYTPSGGYLVSYPGSEFLLAQGYDESGGFNLSEVFSYRSGDEMVEGRFRFLKPGDEELSFLRDYSLFRDCLSDFSSGAIFLCPEESFISVALSLVRGDFGVSNAYQDGAAFVDLGEVRLAAPGYDDQIGTIAFNGLSHRIAFHISDDDGYRLSLPRPAGNINTLGGPLPYDNGDPAMSFAVYLYFCAVAASSFWSDSSLLFLGFRNGDLTGMDFRQLRPVGGLEFDLNSLLPIRIVLLSVFVGAAFLWLIYSFSTYAVRKKINGETVDILRINGYKQRLLATNVWLANAVISFLSVMVGLIFYFSLFVQLANLAQFRLDYGGSYAVLGSEFAPIGAVQWYSASPWIIVFLVLPIVDFLLAYIGLRRISVRGKRGGAQH